MRISDERIISFMFSLYDRHSATLDPLPFSLLGHYPFFSYCRPLFCSEPHMPFRNLLRFQLSPPPCSHAVGLIPLDPPPPILSSSRVHLLSPSRCSPHLPHM